MHSNALAECSESEGRSEGTVASDQQERANALYADWFANWSVDQPSVFTLATLADIPEQCIHVAIREQFHRPENVPRRGRGRASV